MALDLTSRYPGRYGAKSSAYPQGSFENETALGNNDKSYFEQDWANDVFGFLGAILNDAGETPNNVIDTGTASQIFDALIVSLRKNSSMPEFIAELTSGTSFAKPSGFSWFRVTKYGGGGGGDGSDIDTNNRKMGGGGSAGGKVVTYYKSEDLPSSIAYSIGAGGSAGDKDLGPNLSGSGGLTTFNGELPAPGGRGGGRFFLGDDVNWEGAQPIPPTIAGSENMAGPGGDDGVVTSKTIPFYSASEAGGGNSWPNSYGRGGRGGGLVGSGTITVDGLPGSDGAIVIEGFK